MLIWRRGTTGLVLVQVQCITTNKPSTQSTTSICVLVSPVRKICHYQESYIHLYLSFLCSSIVTRHVLLQMYKHFTFNTKKNMLYIVIWSLLFFRFYIANMYPYHSMQLFFIHLNHCAISIVCIYYSLRFHSPSAGHLAWASRVANKQGQWSKLDFR